MDKRTIRPCSRLAEAEWLAGQLAPFGSGVAGIVPQGFPAYIRILHPAHGPGDTAIRWAEVARKSGRTMHRLVQFHAIHRQPAVGSEVDVSPPDPGNLPPDLLRSLCDVLADHTSPPAWCYFCLWEGYGWGDELRAAVPETQRVRLPQRDYLLFEGPLHGAAEFGWSLGDDVVSQSPNLFWPEDRSWCVASEIDLYCTLVGGSIALTERLAADPRLEVWRVGAEDPVTWDSDDKNV